MKQNYYNIKDRVSNSMLGWLEQGPAYYLSKLNNDEEKEISKSLENGSIIHSYIEDPSAFVIAEADKVTGKMGAYIEEFARTGDSEKAYKKAEFSISKEKVEDSFKKEDKNQVYYNYLLLTKTDSIILTKDQKSLIQNVINVINNTPLFLKTLGLDFVKNKELYNEVECYWDYKLKGLSIPVKAKPDVILVDHVQKIIEVSDLKTTSSRPDGILIPVLSQENLTGKAYLDYKGTHWMDKYLKYRYYRQKFFYTEAVKNCEPFKSLYEKGYKIIFNFAVICTGTGYGTAVYTDLSPDMAPLDRPFYAKEEIEYLLLEYHKYIVENNPVPTKSLLLDL